MLEYAPRPTTRGGWRKTAASVAKWMSGAAWLMTALSILISVVWLTGVGPTLPTFKTLKVRPLKSSEVASALVNSGLYKAHPFPLANFERVEQFMQQFAPVMIRGEEGLPPGADEHVLVDELQILESGMSADGQQTWYRLPRGTVTLASYGCWYRPREGRWYLWYETGLDPKGRHRAYSHPILWVVYSNPGPEYAEFGCEESLDQNGMASGYRSELTGMAQTTMPDWRLPRWVSASLWVTLGAGVIVLGVVLGAKRQCFPLLVTWALLVTGLYITILLTIEHALAFIDCWSGSAWARPQVPAVMTLLIGAWLLTLVSGVRRILVGKPA